MKNPERIEKIRQFLDLAEARFKDPATDKEMLIGLNYVLHGHVQELLKMLDEPKDRLDENDPHAFSKALKRAFFGPVIPREEPRPVLTAEPPIDYDPYGMFNFAYEDVPPPGEWADWVKKQGSIERKPDEPTADEILKHTKSCDFRRGLKTCTCA